MIWCLDVLILKVVISLLFATHTYRDYLLDKSSVSCSNSLMDSNSYFFLGLAGAAEAFASVRMSFLTEARSFRVGTLTSNFRRPSSMRGSL